MNKHDLAEQLRECQRQHGATPAHFIDLKDLPMTPRQIIEETIKWLQAVYPKNER